MNDIWTRLGPALWVLCVVYAVAYVAFLTWVRFGDMP